MLKIAVCDDDKWIRTYLKTVIERELSAKPDLYASGEELLLAQEVYDILFLDICLKNGENTGQKNGMETAREIHGKTGTLIIFITAATDYVYEAYDVEAFHYLLKPIDEKKLCEVLHRAAEKAEGKQSRQPLLIKSSGKFLRIPIEDIYYGENEGRKITLHTKNGMFSYYEKMEELEQKLGDDFFRSHRGYLVHLQEVAAYDRTSITLSCGDVVFLAKQKYNDFVAAYMNYLTK